MKKLASLSLAACLLSVGLTAASALAETDLSRFPLARAVPADVFIAVAAKDNPELDFLDAYWQEVIEEFNRQGILDDVWGLITANVPDDDLDEVEEIHDKFSELLSNVEWGALFEKEMIYAGRFSTSFEMGSPYEGILIGRLTKKQAAKNYKSLTAILEELAKLINAKAGEGEFVLNQTKIGGVQFTMLGPQKMPQLVGVGQVDDLLIISLFNRTLAQESIGLLRGESDVTRLIETKRFKKAFETLPAAENSLVFFDISKMFDAIQGMIKMVLSKVSDEKLADANAAAPEDVDKGEIILRMITQLIEDISIVDYLASVEWTDGYRVFSETLTVLKPDGKSKPLYAVLKGGSPVDKFERFVPKEATDFSVGTGISFVELYRYLIGFVEKNIPWAGPQLRQFEQIQKEQWELDIEKDVLALLEGGMVSVAMGNDWVLLVKVTDEKQGAVQIARLLDAVKAKWGGESGLTLTGTEVAGYKGFTQITHPMMMFMGMMQPPVVGLAEGHLILGSSSSSVAKCLKTAQGKHPNIRESKRWRQEALIPDGGPLDKITYADESNMAAQLQAVLGLASMFTFMMNMAGEDLPPEVRGLVGAITPIVAKLGPVVGKIDFYLSSASYSTFDGKRWHERKVQNYKKPKPKAPSEDEDAVGAEKKTPSKARAGVKGEA
ncbi:MAG: hypothetical protein ABII12_11175 [Planctomycetota bacterium]